MQNLGANGQRIFWCPRCGTLRTYTGEHVEDEPPMWTRKMKEALYHHVYAEFIEAADKMLAESHRKACEAIAAAKIGVTP
jgi:hypothetical protein